MPPFIWRLAAKKFKVLLACAAVNSCYFYEAVTPLIVEETWMLFADSQNKDLGSSLLPRGLSE